MSKFGAKSLNTTGKASRGNISVRAIKKLYSNHTDELQSWQRKLGDVDQDAHYLVWKVMCEPQADADSSKAFSQPGDSGALVLNENNELVGMLFGSQTGPGRKTHTSFFTSWASIAQGFKKSSRRSLHCPR